MANIIITSTTNSINFVFNDASDRAGLPKRTINKAFIINIDLYDSEGFILFEIANKAAMKLSYVEGDAPIMAIDSVDGNTSLSNSSL